MGLTVPTDGQGPGESGGGVCAGSTLRLPWVWKGVGTAPIPVTGPAPQFCLLHPHGLPSTASPQGCGPGPCAPCTPGAQQHPECWEETPRPQSGSPQAEGPAPCPVQPRARPQMHPRGCLLRRKCPALRRVSPECGPGTTCIKPSASPAEMRDPGPRHRVRTRKSEERVGVGPRTHLEKRCSRDPHSSHRVGRTDGAGAPGGPPEPPRGPALTDSTPSLSPRPRPPV